MAFRLNCVSELYKNLGKFDAIVEFTELAVEDFISQTSPKEFDLFIEQKSKQHNIKVNTVDQNIFCSRISKNYILSVYQNAEFSFISSKMNAMT